MSRPRVSVIIAARDAAATLPACLRSVRRQTLPDWECLVVDDGSRDATAAQARAGAAADPRVVLVDSFPRARGVVAARAAALAAARGEAVAILDADDLAHRRRLELQWAALEAQGGGLVSAHPRVFPTARLQDGGRRYQAWLRGMQTGADLERARFIEMPWAHSTTMLERRVGDSLAWYRDLPWPEDYDLALRILAAGCPLGVVPRALVAWRFRPDSASRTEARYSLAAFTACRAHALARDYLPPDQPWLLWGHGATGKALRRALASEGRRPTAILEVDPRKIGTAPGGIPIRDARDWLDDPGAGEGSVRLVISVAGPGPRAAIRRALAPLPLREGRDFVFAA